MPSPTVDQPYRLRPPPPRPPPKTSPDYPLAGQAPAGLPGQTSSARGIRAASAGQRNGARCCLSITAISLLWATSLSSILAFLENGGVVATPPFSLVQLKASAFVKETLRLRDEYENCVIESLVLCNTTLQAAISQELQRASDARSRNVRLAENAENLHRKCAAARSKAKNAVAAWRGVTPIPTSPYAPHCPLAMRAHVEAGPVSVDEEIAAAHVVATEYSNQSRGTIARLADQIVARAAYDSEYIYNKTLANARLRELRLNLVTNFSLGLRLHLTGLNVSLLIACATLSPSRELECPGESLRQLVNASQRRLYSSWLGAHTAWADSVTRVDRYTDSAQHLVTEAGQVLDALARWFDKNFPEFGGSFPGGIQRPSLHLGRFGLDVGDIPTIAPPEALSDLYARVKDVVDRYEENLGRATDGANADGTLLQARLAALDVRDMFADYNPPTIDALFLQREHQESSEAFELQSLVASRRVAGASGGERGDAQGVSTGGAAAFKSNNTMWRWLGHAQDLTFFHQFALNNPGVDFGWLAERASLLRRCAVGFDYAYRTVLTVSWIFQFWGRSTLPVPPVHASTAAGVGQYAPKQVYSQAQLAMVVVAHPFSLAILWSCSATVAGGILWTIYEPWLSQYRQGCTAKGYDSSGRLVSVATGNTIVATNAYATAFNIAASHGNEQRIRGLDRYDERTDRACNAYAPGSTAEHDSTAFRVAAAIDAHADVTAEVSGMQECYDIDRIDAELLAYSGSETDLLSHALDEPACGQAVSNKSILPGAFDCVAALPPCAIRCDELSDDQGKDASGLAGFATGAACTAEWWFHSWLVKLLACTVVYLLLNAGRLLCVSGLARLMWKSFNTEIFAYQGSCNIHGQGTYDKEELVFKINEMLDSLKMSGAAMLLASALLQVPWIATFVWLVPELTYAWLA